MTQHTRADPSDEPPQSEGTERPGTQAELVAEQLAERIGRWMLRTTARAKEEAEDIWAEAQALRREL